MRSAIYESVVRHWRFKPMGHQFRYRVYSLLIDLDELDELQRRIPFFSHNRWNLVSFHDRDHGPRDGSNLRSWLAPYLAESGITSPGRIAVMAFPRILGYTFNPLTVWFVHDENDQLVAVLYEIHNTFGHSHTHLVRIEGSERRAKHGFAKTLHVSPFFDNIGAYDVVLEEPGSSYRIVITYVDEEGDRLLTASQTGERRELTTGSLLRQFFTKPLVTLKVIAGIHIHAVRLLAKGAKYRSVPPPPEPAVEVHLDSRDAKSTEQSKRGTMAS